MTIVRLLPVLISMLLVTAHFVRAGQLPLAAVSVALPVILLVRRPWAARLMQAALCLAALEWVRTLVALIAMRRAMGEPWGRMAAIVFGVASITLASTLVFRQRRLRTRYRF